jgi:hypothetical protein
VPNELGARRPFVIGLVVVALLAYSVVALGVQSRWISGLASAVVAWLLWQRHSRARFAAYIFLSAVALRSLTTRRWTTFSFAVAVLFVLQTPAARRAWPRLAWRWSRAPSPYGEDGKPDGRMTRP